MQPMFSAPGSSRQLKEKMMDNFQDLLMALDDGEISGYTSLSVWNDSKRLGDKDIAVDGESMTEKFEVYLSFAGIMKWLTGQKHRQLNGEKVKIQAIFDHECLTRNPVHSLCLPLVGACGRVIAFPVSHMKDYESFKEVFLLGYSKRQEFVEP